MSAESTNEYPGRGQLDGATATVMYTSWRRCFEMGSAVRTESRKEPSISAYTISYVANNRQGKENNRLHQDHLPSTKKMTVARQILNRGGTKRWQAAVHRRRGGSAKLLMLSASLSPGDGVVTHRNVPAQTGPTSAPPPKVTQS